MMFVSFFHRIFNGKWVQNGCQMDANSMAKLSVALKKELQKGMPKVDVGKIKPDRMFVRKCWRKGRPGADGPDQDPAPGEVRGWPAPGPQGPPDGDNRVMEEPVSGGLGPLAREARGTRGPNIFIDIIYSYRRYRA